MPEEYWRWAETHWVAPDRDWRGAGSITSGIDVGSVSSQAVILVDGEPYAYSSIRTGSDSPKSARKAMDWAMEDTGLTMSDIKFTVGTGYGRVNVPFADRAITEIACHARGANFLFGPTVRTILDMGGQDCKAIRCDERGKVTSFLMNDKCAAGAGRGMEVMAELLAVPIDEVGPRSLDVEEEPPPVSSTCVVFAKSEALGLMRQGWDVNRVLAAYCLAMAQRVIILLEQLGIEEDFAITGGISKNPGMAHRIEKAVGLKALEPRWDAQLAGALGAALFAETLLQKAAKAA